MTLVVAVKPAHHPGHAPSPAGQAELLRPHLRPGLVIERRVESPDALRQPDTGTDNARVERIAVARDLDVATRERRDRCETHGGVQRIVQIDGPEEELVAVRLLLLREQLAWSQ